MSAYVPWLVKREETQTSDLESRILHGSSSVLDHDGFSSELLQVGQGFRQDDNLVQVREVVRALARTCDM